MQPWPPPDSHPLLAAQGWLELGNWREANVELEKLKPQAELSLIGCAIESR